MPRRKKSSHENQSRSSLSINKDKPQQRYAANARERARMRVLSRAFCRLKTTLPWVPADTKLSKLDTLRLAASYIAHLKGILTDETLGSSESSLHPAMSMTWPFGFNRPLGGSAGGGSHEGGSILGSEDDEDDDEEDIDDEDGESISSCTWEEVSPPSTKECIHLDTRSSSRGRARGKMSGCNTSTRQVNNKKETSSSPSPISTKHNMNLTAKSEDFPSDNCNTNSTTTTIRPFSQTQHHHHHHQHHHLQEEDHLQNEDGMFHHFEREIKSNNMSSSVASHMMVVTNLENAPPHLVHSTVSPQNGDYVGVGNPNMSSNSDSFLADINSPSFTQLSHHINHVGSEMHHHAPSAPFAFGNSDLISIG